jgi:hypothetical protein
MSKSTPSEKLKELSIVKTGDPDGKYQLFTIKVRTIGSKLYQKEVLIEHTHGISHELKTLANYLEFMAESFKREEQK